MGGGFSYDKQKSIVILLAEFFFFWGGGGGGERGRNLHDISIKSIYGTTTLMHFKDI